MYAPPESRSAKVAGKAASARPAASEPDPLLAARAASLNARPQVRQLKKKEDGLGGRPEIRSLAAARTEPNRTGLPDRLKAGVESLSGVALDDVRVHYASSKPAALQAKAYTQGSEIHVAPGEERHLPHEAWHVAQQKQGRVKATTQARGVPINDDKGLEREADAMGARAAAIGKEPSSRLRPRAVSASGAILQGYYLRQIQEAREGISDLHFRYDDDIAGNAQNGENLHITVTYTPAPPPVAAGAAPAPAPAPQMPITRHCYYNYNNQSWRWDTAPAAAVQQVAEAQQGAAINWARQFRAPPPAPVGPVAPREGPRHKLGKMPRKGKQGTTTKL